MVLVVIIMYEIRKQRQPTQLVICKQNDLIDHHVLGIYHISNFAFVSLKYGAN